MKSLETRVPPPLVALVTMGLMWAAAHLWPELGMSFSLQMPFALAVAGLGLICDLTSALSFMRANTTINPMTPGRSTRLVVSGWYRISRNPMYLGFLLMLSGFALYLGHLLALLCLPLFVLYIQRFQIMPEERAMAELFGDEFSRYCQRVRRWV